MNLEALLLAACAGLSGLGLSSLLVLRTVQRQNRLALRIAAITAPHRRERDAGPRLIRLPGTFRATTLWRRLAGLIGYDPERREIYPVPWWVVTGLAVLLGRILAHLGTALVGAAAEFATPALAIWLSRSFFGWYDSRRKDALFRQFPDALAMIVRAVRVGIPVGEAVRMVARESAPPTGPEFARLADQIAIGVTLEEALRRMGRRNDLAEYRFFATALSLQAQTGGGLAETLENLADVIRKRVALKARGHALSSEAKTSAGILCALPGLALLGLWLLNPAYIVVLFVEPSGQHILGAAALLLLLGIYVMRIMIRRSLS